MGSILEFVIFRHLGRNFFPCDVGAIVQMPAVGQVQKDCNCQTLVLDSLKERHATQGL